MSDDERETLQRWTRRRSTAQALALRSRIVLGCAAGVPNRAVAAGLGVHPVTVGKWRSRFVEHRLDGLLDDPRPGISRTVSDAQVEALIVTTLEQAPKEATRSIAAATGLSQSTVSRMWRVFGLAPHRVESFNSPKDPLFVEKVRDVVGLYLDPPERALVLCVNERSQSQALDRTEAVFPLLPGVPERRSYDYVRAGTTSLFAALDMASGQVIGSLHARHRAIECKGFLARLDRETPPDLDIHLILDNYATHKTPAVHRWLLAYPRFHLPSTPTSASWLDMVERWFSELTEKKIRRGTHRTVAPRRRCPGRRGRPRPRRGRETARSRCRSPPRPTGGHPGLDHRLERPPQAVRLGQDRRRHPRQRRPLLSTNL